ncbi:hypothetical protein ACJX0J_016098, partial [Zea mays]
FLFGSEFNANATNSIFMQCYDNYQNIQLNGMMNGLKMMSILSGKNLIKCALRILKNLFIDKYDGSDIQEHIMKMSNIVAKIKMEMDISDGFLCNINELIKNRGLKYCHINQYKQKGCIDFLNKSKEEGNVGELAHVATIHNLLLLYELLYQNYGN